MAMSNHDESLQGHGCGRPDPKLPKLHFPELPGGSAIGVAPMEILGEYVTVFSHYDSIYGKIAGFFPMYQWGSLKKDADE